MRICVICSLTAAIAAPTHAAIRLEAIDLVGYNFGLPWALSGDGQHVGGTFGSPSQGFQWHASDSSVDLLPTPPFAGNAIVSASSFTGTTLGVNDSAANAYRYRGGVYTKLGPSTDVTYCSDDGELLAGMLGNSNGWTWTAADGYRSITNFHFRGGTGSGSFLVGDSSNRAAVRTSDGAVSLLANPAGATSARAVDISTDGSIVAGDANSRVYRWVGGAPVALPVVPTSPAAAMYVTSMSDDGNVMFGNYNSTGGGPRGDWLWTPALGTVDLRTYLQSRGVSVGGFVFLDSMECSADGLSFAGTFGVSQPFYLRFDSLPIPAPATSVVAILLLSCPRRRR